MKSRKTIHNNDVIFNNMTLFCGYLDTVENCGLRDNENSVDYGSLDNFIQNFVENNT